MSNETNESSQETEGAGGFCGVGTWSGTAEVYSGTGQFLGNAADQRHVRTIEDDGRTRIDLSFVGPLKFAGHYYIVDHGAHRLYQGPANIGFAEAYGTDVVDANAYWPLTGLSQKFFLMMLPSGDKQLSLSLMYRGEQLVYSIASENDRLVGSGVGATPSLVNGISYDLADDPTAGRGEILLHRPGTWTGELATSIGETSRIEQTVAPDGDVLAVTERGSAFSPEAAASQLRTNGYQAWTLAGDAVGSYSLSGGRALAGSMYRPARQLRVWRREVVSHDGAVKAVVNAWYRGGERVGVEYGVLTFEGASR